MLKMLPCLDSDEMSESRRRELWISRSVAAELGRTAVEAAATGSYTGVDGKPVEWSRLVRAASAEKVSIPPQAPLEQHERPRFLETRIQVTNETTLGASRRLVDDPMYDEHARRPRADSTDWAIHSPDVPVFRHDDGTPLESPWVLCFLTCAAPYAPAIGEPEAGELLQRRIQRVLAIARAYGHAALVLGAWGCGAFENDPKRTAQSFRHALEGDFEGAFSDVTFAIADWSPERRFLGPFRAVFSAE